jgi:Gamma-glutamyl phosphate reductase
MTAAVTTSVSTQEKLLRARAASSQLALLSTAEKNALLLAIAAAVESRESSILQSNRADVEASGLEGAMRDRLLLTPSRISEMARGVRDVAALPDPIGDTLAEWRNPTACAFGKCACRWAWSGLSTNRVPM